MRLVQGRDHKEIMFNLGEFLEKVLRVPQSNLRESDIDTVKKKTSPTEAYV